jgi:hypothetical protein
MELLIMYVVSVIIVLTYTLFNNKKILEESYKYDKKEFIKWTIILTLLPVGNTIMAILMCLEVIFHIYHYIS